MSIDISNDPFLTAEVERLIAPYRALLPAEALDAFRDVLIESLTEHPVGVEDMKRLRPRAAVVKSGEQVSEGAADESDRGGEKAGGSR
jgi:hypothetical protein